MTKNNSTIPKGYKQTKIGVLPVEWEVVTVGKAFTIDNSPRKPISGEVRKGMQGIYPYYGPTKIQDYINEYQYEGKRALIAEDGDHFLKYANKEMTQIAEGQFNVNNHAHVINASSTATVDWFYYFFQHRSIFSHLTRQGAGRYKLNKSALQALPVALPPLPEQQKIAKILATWDDAIQTLTQLIDTKKDQKRGLMQRLLTGEVRLPGFELSKEKVNTKFGQFPADWLVVKIKEIATEVSRKNKKGIEYPVMSCTKHSGLVDSLKYFGKRIFSKDTSTYKMVERNQFAYATNHIEEGSIGYQDIHDIGLISPMYTAFKTNNKVDDAFLYRVLKSPLFVHKYGANTSASVDRRGSLRWKQFSLLKLSLPSLKEQRAIANILNTADQELTLLETQLTEIKEQKRGLMQRLLTGAVRVNVAN